MRFKSTYVWLCAAFILASCSQENDFNTEIESVTADAVYLKSEVPLEENDFTHHGLYHGTILSAETMSRGKIWVNIANNGIYDAYIELVSGINYTFNLKAELTAIEAGQTVYEFIGDAGSFVFDISDISSPELISLELDGEAFFSQIVKSYSSYMPMSETATFFETGNPSFSGSWSILADGIIQNPNGDLGLAISSIMIVHDGILYEDFSFDAFNSSSCLGSSTYVPTLNSFGTAGSIVCDYQTTQFAGGVTKWSISYDDDTSTYMDYIACSSQNAGYFMWTSPDNTIIRVGEIELD